MISAQSSVNASRQRNKMEQRCQSNPGWMDNRASLQCNRNSNPKLSSLHPQDLNLNSLCWLLPRGRRSPFPARAFEYAWSEGRPQRAGEPGSGCSDSARRSLQADPLKPKTRRASSKSSLLSASLNRTYFSFRNDQPRLITESPQSLALSPRIVALGSPR